MEVARHNSKITIAMPVFNGGHFFRLALESALDQSHTNTEIIVVDDGSTDNGETRSIATGTGSPKVRYFWQPNNGPAGALNRAVQEATGDFFCWLSHDDIYLPNKLSAQIGYHSRLGKPDAILFSNFEHIDESGRIIERVQFDRSPLLRSSKLALMHSYINGCTVFIPMPLLRAAGPFDVSLRYTQDYEMWHRLLASNDFFHQAETLVQYRIHPAQESNRPEVAHEASRLWIQMMRERTEIERAQMFGSRSEFFRHMARFLGGTEYRAATKFAREQANKSLKDVLVSVVIPVTKNSELTAVHSAIVSALNQTHSSIEVVVVPIGGTEAIALLRRYAGVEPRIRVARASGFSLRDGISKALRAARGDYVALLEPPASFVSTKIERQLLAMSDSGLWLSCTGWAAETGNVDRMAAIPGGGADDRRAPLWSTLMAHRAILAAGFELSDITCGDRDRGWPELAARYPPLTIDAPLTILAK